MEADHSDAVVASGKDVAPAEFRSLARRYAPEMLLRLVRVARTGDARAAVDAAKTVLAHGMGAPASTLQLGEGGVPVLAILAAIDVTGRVAALPQPVDVTAEAQAIPASAGIE